MGVVVMMPLRVAKKIFNRVGAYEEALLLEFDSFIQSTPDQREATLRMFHRMAIAFCGYTDAQVDAAIQRLQRTLRNYVRRKYGGRVSADLVWSRHAASHRILAWY